MGISHYQGAESLVFVCKPFFSVPASAAHSKLGICRIRLKLGVSRPR